MNLSSALNAALTGLTASARRTSLISDNIANASTPGYGQRDVRLGSQLVGGGVRVEAITRRSDPVLTANRRAAEASNVSAETVTNFYAQMVSTIGSPSDPNSITARLAEFEAGLIEAAARPDSTTRLDQVAAEGAALAKTISDASYSIQDMRTRADAQIDNLVTELNTALGDLHELNTKITSTEARGSSSASLLDQRQRVIDEINLIIPVNVAPREFGQVAIYSTGGAILLDGNAVDVGFTPTNIVVPEMSLADGDLSGLTLNGFDVNTSSSSGMLGDGLLQAAFQIRDNLGTEVQADLDALARDLVERFQSPTVDSTLAPTDAGLFTDLGGPFDPLNEVGLAGRLTLNPLVDLNQSGETWRIRDGLGAATPGSVGDSTLLTNLRTALTTSRSLGSGSFGSGLMTAADVGSAMVSAINASSGIADRALSFTSATTTELKEIELSRGVDTDEELRNLLTVEQAYAANARVIEVVSDLMDQLLRI